MVSNLVKYKFHNSVGNFIEYVEVGTNQKLEKNFISDVTRELIYDQTFQISTIANVVNVISSTGSSKRVLTTNQSTIRIQKNGNVQIVGMYCTNVVAN
jgi:hypothetical protein